MTSKEIHENMVNKFGVAPPCYASIKKWIVDFKWRKESTKDYPQLGHPKLATTDDQVEAIHHMVMNDRCVIVQPLTSVLAQFILF